MRSVIDLISHWAALHRANQGPDTSRAPVKLIVDQQLLFEVIKDISVRTEASNWMPVDWILKELKSVDQRHVPASFDNILGE